MSFPVDDVTLDALEHSLGGAYQVDEDGTHHLVGAEYSFMDFLEFMSGYDASKLELLEGEEWKENPIYYYPEAVYAPTDVISALIEEVRRLRGTT